MVAVIYEPRGPNGDGRMAYVGWARLESAPELSDQQRKGQETRYRVRYADRYSEFDRPVPREATGQPIETWLRGFSRGRERNVATFGRAVRPLLDQDLQVVMTLGSPNGVERYSLETSAEHLIAEGITTDDRSRRLVSAVQREARFRDEILAAYDHRCALSGLAVGQSPSRAYGLLDAAHIRPVGRQGADSLANGLALTPTLHRLFDRGLFTLTYRGPVLEVRTSPRLHSEMIRGREGFELRLTDGLELSLPRAARARPASDALEYHQSQVFLAR